MAQVRAKKHLGQHFLKDLEVARRIADSLALDGRTSVLEIGPGMGVLTQFLLQNPLIDLTAIAPTLPPTERYRRRLSQAGFAKAFPGKVLHHW